MIGGGLGGAGGQLVLLGSVLNPCPSFFSFWEWRRRILRLGDMARASEAFLPALVLVGPFRIAVEPVPFAASGRLLLELLRDDAARNNQERGALVPFERTEHVDMAVTLKFFGMGVQQPVIRRCALVRLHLNGPRTLTLIRDEKVRAESVSCGKRNHEATMCQFSSSKEHTLHSVLELQTHRRTPITSLARKQEASNTDLAHYPRDGQSWSA